MADTRHGVDDLLGLIWIGRTNLSCLLMIADWFIKEATNDLEIPSNLSDKMVNVSSLHNLITHKFILNFFGFRNTQGRLRRSWKLSCHQIRRMETQRKFNHPKVSWQIAWNLNYCFVHPAEKKSIDDIKCCDQKVWIEPHVESLDDRRINFTPKRDVYWTRFFISFRTFWVFHDENYDAWKYAIKVAEVGGIRGFLGLVRLK